VRKFLLLLGILGVTLGAKAQSFKKFKPGRYYDLENQKHEGFIYRTIPASGMFKGKGDHITFLATKGSKKETVESSQLSSFVIETDSFVVSHDTTFFKKRPFLQVLLNTPVKIYLSRVQAGSYIPVVGLGVAGAVGGAVAGAATGLGTQPIIYFYGVNPENVGNINNKNFIDVMCRIMRDKPLITAKIKDQYFRLKDMDELLDAYKTGIIKERPKDNNTYDGYN
jgi:hypothetical protein